MKHPYIHMYMCIEVEYIISFNYIINYMLYIKDIAFKIYLKNK